MSKFKVKNLNNEHHEILNYIHHYHGGACASWQLCNFYMKKFNKDKHKFFNALVYLQQLNAIVVIGELEASQDKSLQSGIYIKPVGILLNRMHRGEAR